MATGKTFQTLPPPGVNGYVLTADSTAKPFGIAWESIANNPLAFPANERRLLKVSS